MRLLLSARALRDLRKAVDHIAQDNPMAASRTEARLREAATRLAEFPQLGPAFGGHSQDRIFSVPGTPFRLVYRVGSDRLTILRIWHGARGTPPKR